MSKKKKLLVIIVAAVIGLLFYANLIALNIIIASQLSMYAAAGVAVTLTIIALILSFIGKRSPTLPRNLNKSVIETAKMIKPSPSIIRSPINIQRSAKPSAAKVEKNNYLSNKQPAIQPNKQQLTQTSQKPTVQIEKQPTPQNVKPPIVEKTLPIRQEAKEEKNGKLSCSNCGKEFSQPILMADYSVPDQPDLVPHCPYCFKPTGSKQKNTPGDEAWRKYV